MSLRYALQPDPLHDSGAFHAHVVSPRTLELKDLVARMAAHSSGFAASALLGVTSALMEEVAAALRDGFHVNLPICRLRASIRGKFASQEETFSPSRHQVTVSAAAGTALKKKLRGVKVQRVEGKGGDRPRPTALLSGAARQQTGVLVPGDFAEILGRRLKFDPAGEGEGIFFAQVLTPGDMTPPVVVKVTALATRTDGRLLFQVPALAPGKWSCEVRRRFGRSGTLLRTGFLSQSLVVEE